MSRRAYPTLYQLLIIISLIASQHQLLLHQIDLDTHAGHTACDQCTLFSDLGQSTDAKPNSLTIHSSTQSHTLLPTEPCLFSSNAHSSSLPRAPPLS